MRWVVERRRDRRTAPKPRRSIDALSDDELGRRLDALAHLATAELYLDQFAAIVPHAERAVRIGRATGQGDLFPLIVPMLGASLWIQGRMAESGEVLDGAIAAARLVDNVQGLAWNLFNRSYAAYAAGDIELALDTAEEAFELSQELDEGPVPAHAAVALAYALFETGDCGAGRRAARHEGGRRRAPADRRRLAGPLPRAADALSPGGRADARTPSAPPRQPRRAPRPWACRWPPRWPAVRQPHWSSTPETPVVAAARARAAADALEEIGDAFYAATSRMLAGRALAEAGERDGAAAEFERAAAAFDSFGSIRYRDEAERELRKLGRPTRRRSKPGKADGTGVATLSQRELQVGRLVVDRKTNPEIAAELFLSLKTVESHLRNIFRKLDVRSRVEVARAIERADRADAGSAPERERTAGVVAAERLTAERDRLQAEVRANMDELRRSRARIVEAGDTERRRLERNLHDGAQQRLVSLSLSLSLMEAKLRAPSRPPRWRRCEPSSPMRSTSSASSRVGCTRRSSSTTASAPPSTHSPAGSASRSSSESISTAGCPPRSKRPRTTSSPRA